MVTGADDEVDPTHEPLIAAQEYLSLPGDVTVEFVRFEYRFASLLWLHHMIERTIAARIHELEALRESGDFFIPGWKAEAEAFLNESILAMKLDMAPIGCGVVLAACAAAVESLLADLLPEDKSDRQSMGLHRRSQALINHWTGDVDDDTLLNHVSWLAKRRNSFAHRLTDDADLREPQGDRYEFDRDTVEEAFERVAEILAVLAHGHDEYSRRHGG